MKIEIRWKSWVRRHPLLFVLSVVGTCLLTMALWLQAGDLGSLDASSHLGVTREEILKKIGSQVLANNFPVSIDEIGGHEKAFIEYSLRQDMQRYSDELLSTYRPDYAAFVALDARTGEILSLSSYSRKAEFAAHNLALLARFPSASIFKVVTATAAIDQDRATADTIVPFNGANHTLYKKNIETTSHNRWTRYMTLKQAFALSANSFFGKLGLYQVGPLGLREYAEKYLFNVPIASDLPVEEGIALIPTDDDWGVVEASSGYTRENKMSPLQGALLAAAAVNDGMIMRPHLVRSIVDSDGATLYQAETEVLSTAMREESARQVRELMRETVRSGTSRKAFRNLMRKAKYSEVEFGGKTGSLNAVDPKGKTDWFVGYMRYKDRRIAVAAASIHGDLWRVRSSQLASLYFEHYLRGMSARPNVQANR